MTLDFTLTENDLVDAYLALTPFTWKSLLGMGPSIGSPTRRSSGRTMTIVGFSAFFGGTILTAVGGAWLAYQSRSAVSILGLVPVLLLVLIVLQIARSLTVAGRRKRAAEAFHKRPEAIHPVSVDMDQSVFVRRCDHYRISVEWSAFGSFRETPSLLLLLVDQVIHIIPKRAFASQADLDAAIRLIQERVSQSKT